jgi:hypothetical protein
MHVMDLSAYVGYSRYMLLFAPMIICGAHGMIRLGAVKVPRLTTAALLLVLASNFFLCPIRRDGARKCKWGNYRCDTSEHYYPYRAALTCLQERYPDDRILLAGMYYPYYHQYYTGDDDRITTEVASSADEPLPLERALRSARAGAVPHVLYHVLDSSTPLPARHGDYRQEKVFRNSSHMLVLYSVRPEPATRPVSESAPSP